MHSFVRKFPQFALLGGQGRKKLYLYDTTDPDSVLWAQMTVASKDHVPFMSVKGSRESLSDSRAVQGTHDRATRREAQKQRSDQR